MGEKKTSNSVACLLLQMLPQSHRRVHEDAIMKGSAELVKRCEEHMAKTKEADVLQKKKVGNDTYDGYRPT